MRMRMMKELVFCKVEELSEYCSQCAVGEERIGRVNFVVVVMKTIERMI